MQAMSQIDQDWSFFVSRGQAKPADTHTHQSTNQPTRQNKFSIDIDNEEKK